MTHQVSVAQLRGIRYDKGAPPFLNVVENVYAAIGVWGNVYNSPTYLFIKDHNFYLMQFVDNEVAGEWMSENCLSKDGWKCHSLNWLGGIKDE